MVALLLGLQFRHPLPIFFCLIPLGCGLAAALGLMGLLGIELNVLTLAVAPILVGLCLDDGVHILEALERGESALAAFQFHSVRELGLVVSFGILAALLAALHLVPLCHGLIRGGREIRTADVTQM